MKHAISALCCTLAAGLAACAAQPDRQVSEGAKAAPSGVPAEMSNDARMAWWREARFGMFIHWGVYSVPAGTWNGKTTGGPSEWIMQSLHVPTTEYVKFADGFTADKYEPADWAKLAKQAGMKYVVITSRHHDGFCLWDSPTSEWDVMASPAKRDLLKPLADATRREGLHFCTYYSILDWRHPDYEPKRAWNDRPEWNGGPGYKTDFQGRFVPYVHQQVAEVIKDVDPDVLWFDGEWEDSWTEADGRALYNHVRSLKPSIIVNNRVGKSRNDTQGFTRKGVEAMGDFCTPEQEVPPTGLPGVDWETCMTMNDSWGFKSSDHHWKSATEIVRTLCDVASKGGNFLLNIGPKPDGTIPQESIDRLQAVGRWMSLNGEAIYGTQASPFKKLAWGRATQKLGADGKASLYLMVFDWPETGDLAVPGLSPLPSSARVLTMDKMLRKVQIIQGKDGVQLSGLGKRPAGTGEMPVVVRLDFDGPMTVVAQTPRPIPAWQGGVYTLRAEQAEIDGSSLRVQGAGKDMNLGYWTNNSDKAYWMVKDLHAGSYRVELVLACQPSDAGCGYEVALGDSVVKGVVPDTGSWHDFKVVSLDGFRVAADAPTARLEVRAAGDLKGGLMNLQTVRIIPVH